MDAATTTAQGHTSGAPTPPPAGGGLVEQHLWLVKREATRMVRRLPRHIACEDLMGAGCLGLMRAAQRFDPSRGVTFDTFATFTVRGAIKDELRTMDVLPRRSRAGINRLQRARRAFSGAHQAPPSTPELAEAAGLAVETVETLLQLEHSARTPVDADGLDLMGCGAPAPQDAVERRDIVRRLAAAMGQLTPKQQQVLAQHYQADRTFKDIGAQLGVTESRACQIHAEALLALRDIL